MTQITTAAFPLRWADKRGTKPNARIWKGRKLISVYLYTHLHRKGKRSPLEMLFHHRANFLGRLKQIGHFIGTQISEALHWPKGTHEDICSEVC